MRPLLRLAACLASFGLFACGVAEVQSTNLTPDLDVDDFHGSRACTTKSIPTYALHGTVLTPQGPVVGTVVVTNETITQVVPDGEPLPDGVTALETSGVISPGFIDLHNHVAYDFLPFWNSGKRWQNRYQWARATGYQSAVKNPYNAVKKANHLCEAQKYGEFRALVGGTTTIQGSNDLTCDRSWVRNVEYGMFCQDHVGEMVLPVTALTQSDADKLNAQFASGHTAAYLVHLAEGVDDSSRAEFDHLEALGLLQPQLVAIHGTALDATRLQKMGAAGMKLVWSPLSNLALYGQTTDIPTALSFGVKVALAPDWSPSGSANVLGEFKVADRVNRERFGGILSDYDLWQMVTANPADIAGVGDKLGRIAPGFTADLVVIRPQGVVDPADPYRSIIDAQPQDVLLTTIGGDPYYGDPTLLDQLGQAGTYTVLSSCDGELRGLRVQDPASGVPNASESLDQVNATFAGDQVSSVVPLYGCDAAPEWAFH
ncbi:MAG: amidohydrolase family protein [Deltaproteobacteria bacterium]|nr:amidohydrolase family protein [Deltaproteobacteria bacterium]